MSASGRAMAYSNSKISYQSSYSTYYLTYSDGSFANTSSGSTIQLFTKAVGADGIDLPNRHREGRPNGFNWRRRLPRTTPNSALLVSRHGKVYASLDQNGCKRFGTGTAVIAATPTVIRISAGD
jgi:hypothetical protein